MLDKTIVQHTRSKQGCIPPPSSFIHSFIRSRVLPRSSTTTLQKRTRTRDWPHNCCANVEASKLYTLSEEVLVLILEYLDARTLIRLSKTCRLFHRLCHSDVIWRRRCKVGNIRSILSQLTVFHVSLFNVYFCVTLVVFLAKIRPKSYRNNAMN